MSNEPANARITLRNLIAASWVLVALAGAAVGIAALFGEQLPAGLLPRSEHPLGVVACLVTWAVLNVASTIALQRQLASERLAGAQLLVDAIALTVLLALSGGPANPFTILYFLPITLATQVSPRWTWTLAGVCLACFAALFVLTPDDEHLEAPAVVEAPQTDLHAHHHHHTPADVETPTDAHTMTNHAEHFEGHQRGMWVAFGLAGVLITVFVHRTALALSRQRDELVALRQASLEDRHLSAVGTLAAGAAHELGTPLGTINVLLDELPHMSADEADEARATMREQLQRCKLIVSRMASPELRVSALGTGESWRIAELGEELSELPLGVPMQVHTPEAVAAQTSRQPFEVLSQLLRELVNNAADACRRTGDPTRGIELRFDQRGDRMLVDVIDAGIGMDTETLASVFEPFHTTRPEGQGMGLGLYLARAHLRQLGGSITLESTLGRGTTVHVEFPLVGAEVPT